MAPVIPRRFARVLGDMELHPRFISPFWAYQAFPPHRPDGPVIRFKFLREWETDWRRVLHLSSSIERR